MVERTVGLSPIPPLRLRVTITPAVAIRMAAAESGVILSPRKINPNKATCTGSVLM